MILRKKPRYKMVKLNPKFKAIRRRDSPRYVLLTGGRGSSKSFGVATIISDRVCSPGHSVLYTRYTMSSANLSIIPEIEEKMELLGVSQHFKTAEKIITNKVNGSNIIFRGLKTSAGNQTANLKSLQGITTWVLDEADELDEEDDFDKIDMSVRSKNQKNQVILILNPTTTDHWIWKRWFENSHRVDQVDGCDVFMSTHPDVLHIHFTYLDNLDHLDPVTVSLWQKMKINKPQKYAHTIIGGWLNAREGVIYDQWAEKVFNDTLPYCFGLDYGYTAPLAVIKVAVDKKKKEIYLKQYGYKEAVDDVPGFLDQQGVSKRDLIIADTNEPRTTKKIKDAKFNIEKVKKGKIADDIRGIKDWTIYVDPDSHDLKKEFRNYIWNDKKAEVPVEEYNHLLDAMRYAFYRLTGRRKMKVKSKNRARSSYRRAFRQ